MTRLTPELARDGPHQSFPFSNVVEIPKRPTLFIDNVTEPSETLNFSISGIRSPDYDQMKAHNNLRNLQSNFWIETLASKHACRGRYSTLIVANSIGVPFFFLSPITKLRDHLFLFEGGGAFDRDSLPRTLRIAYYTPTGSQVWVQ